MKKIIITALLLPLLMVNNGCKKYVEGNEENPNAPSKVTPALLLSASEVSFFVNYTGQLARISTMMTQQTVGTQFQFADIEGYTIREGDDDNEFQSLYTDCLINEKTLISTVGNNSPWYRGIAEVLKAMTLGILTDTWGDVPDKEALGGLDQNYTPHFDKQEDIYNHIQSLLDSAIVDLSTAQSANQQLPSADDFIHNGDPNAWKVTAYMLKARYHNHLSKIDPAGSATNALTDINNSGASSPADDANAVFGEDGSNQNTYYTFYNSRKHYMQMAKRFIDLLQMPNDTDPRLPFFASTDVSGGYSGNDVNDPSTTTSNIGDYYQAPAAPLPMVSYVEMLFIKAEASLRAGDAPTAADALNQAVITSVTQVTGSAPDAGFITNHASETAGTVTLEKIMTQKNIALFLQYEVWTDWRRTGFPQLTPNPDGTVAGIPRRLPTSLVERQYNPNAVVVANILTPVWWDQQ